MIMAIKRCALGALGLGEIAASYSETIVRQVLYRPCSIDKYLTWASARLNDPGPYAFSTLCASIAEVRYNQVSKDFTAITGREPESSRFPSSGNVRESGRLHSRLAVP